jgi:hypothetical protein
VAIHGALGFGDLLVGVFVTPFAHNIGQIRDAGAQDE